MGARRSALVPRALRTLKAGIPATKDERPLGRWLVFLATVFWGGTATLARSVFRDGGVPPLTVVELRLVIATTLLLVWMALRNRAALRIERRDIGYFLVLGLLGVAAVQGTYYFSIARLGVGLAILLQYVAPSLIVLWDIVRGQRPSPTTVLAVGLALGGTALLVNGIDAKSLAASPLDWAIGFSSAIIFAFYVDWTKMRPLRKEAYEQQKSGKAPKPAAEKPSKAEVKAAKKDAQAADSTDTDSDDE